MPDESTWPIIYTRDLQIVQSLLLEGWSVLAMEGTITVMGNPRFFKTPQEMPPLRKVFGPQEMWPIRYSTDEDYSDEIRADGWIEAAYQEGLTVFINPILHGLVALPLDRN